MSALSRPNPCRGLTAEKEDDSYAPHPATARQYRLAPVRRPESVMPAQVADQQVRPAALIRS